MSALSSEPQNTVALGWARRSVLGLFLAALSALWLGAGPLASRPAGAQELGLPEGRVILTISGRIDHTNAKGVAEIRRIALPSASSLILRVGTSRVIISFTNKKNGP